MFFETLDEGVFIFFIQVYLDQFIVVQRLVEFLQMLKYVVVNFINYQVS